MSISRAFAADVVVVGAGAAGLAAALFTARPAPGLRVAALDGATRLGAKILVSGGGRCNVTHREVDARDFFGGSPHIIRRVLATFDVPRTIAFFHEIGVPLHVEETGKLFPDSNRAQTVLDALLHEARRLQVDIQTGHRVVAIERDGEGFQLHVQRRTASGPQELTVAARRVILASGGQSLPKTGSDGFGYELARHLGHTLIPTTPALVPLLLDSGAAETSQPNSGGANLGGVRVPPSTTPPSLPGRRLKTRPRSLPGRGRGEGSGPAPLPTFPLSHLPMAPSQPPCLHTRLQGVAHPAELAIHVAGMRPQRLRGDLLWTHFGVSGPVVLDASRIWLRARLEQRGCRIDVNFLPGEDFAAAERRFLALNTCGARATVQNVLARWLPARLASALLQATGISPQRVAGQLPRDDRRRLVRALTVWPLPVVGDRGWNYAEATAGGVPLTEIHPATLESRVCPGLYLVGEILDVDGRIGGFNFQWAWSSAFVAGSAIVRG